MNKAQFLKKLDNALKSIPTEERADILRDYREHFATGLTNGKEETEIAAALGSPEQIAKELSAMYHLDRVETTGTIGNLFRATFAIIGLSFFNLIIVLAPLCAAAGLIFAGWVTGASLLITPLIVTIVPLVTADPFEWFHLFGSLVFLGIGILLLIAMYKVTKVLSNWFIRYLKYNASIVKGGTIRD